MRCDCGRGEGCGACRIIGRGQRDEGIRNVSLMFRRSSLSWEEERGGQRDHDRCLIRILID
jgi:hypothetical protein